MSTLRPIEFEVRTDTGQLLGTERINENGQWEKQFAGRTDWLLDTMFFETFSPVRRQFTGLGDRNGIKIFEGDRIKRPSSNGTAEQMAYGTVCYDLGGFYIQFDGHERQNTTLFKLSIHAKECEIIGNSHHRKPTL